MLMCLQTLTEAASQNECTPVRSRFCQAFLARVTTRSRPPDPAVRLDLAARQEVHPPQPLRAELAVLNQPAHAARLQAQPVGRSLHREEARRPDGGARRLAQSA